jgi:integrase
VLAVHCGLRQGELLGLKWADVDLESGTLQVRRTMSETCTGRVEEETKSGKGRRIELSHTVIDALRRSASVRTKNAAKAGVQVVESKPRVRLSKGHPNELKEPILL